MSPSCSATIVCASNSLTPSPLNSASIALLAREKRSKPLAARRRDYRSACPARRCGHGRRSCRAKPRSARPLTLGASQINRLHLRRQSLVSITHGAITAGVLNGLLLIAVVAGGQGTTVVLTVLVMVLVTTVGCIFPNIAALAFGNVRE